MADESGTPAMGHLIPDFLKTPNLLQPFWYPNVVTYPTAESDHPPSCNGPFIALPVFSGHQYPSHFEGHVNDAGFGLVCDVHKCSFNVVAPPRKP